MWEQANITCLCVQKPASLILRVLEEWATTQEHERYIEYSVSRPIFALDTAPSEFNSEP
jgi:hypothetical protein